MEMVLRAAAIYLILLIIFKIAGRRTLMQLTNFDLILLLIISEATQQAMLSTDYSVTGVDADYRHPG
ncbi:membrane protein [Klebsiella pneumoniae]|uniref:Membrane protein n=1 Tax=Klebsiella pneumoniae subsp. ozaenae TaxID=574 RepID=A0A378B4K0_KLEPO|nr:membrane protein [Klebsiella pneumoniae subsp. ozaenae]STW69459.1 membrane protein [Klebsiella pneumoniae]